MKNWDEDDGSDLCTAERDYRDASAVAEKLQIPLSTVNFAHEYWELVFREFLQAHQSGHTPNPDILCNREIKFGVFFDLVSPTVEHQIATGHYVRTTNGKDGVKLYRGVDNSKDQSYFLSGVARQRLGTCTFPLGNRTKAEVRAIARKEDLPVHNKRDSTGICFIGKRNFSSFIAQYIDNYSGEIVDTNENILGEHRGLHFYTLGQRQGIGVGGTSQGRDAPWYVVEKRAKMNQLVVAQDQSLLLNNEIEATDINWLVNDPELHSQCQAMVRYRQKPQNCEYSVTGNVMSIKFMNPQRAITPGQYVVFYDQDLCIGSAKIQRVLN